jgi:tRNA A-37 threonylcarbamoyl transferase component Bud32
LQSQNLAVLQPDAVFHERYRVVRALGVGGMGAIYEVQDAVTRARRALKVMRPDVVGDPEMRARFAREARITGDVESDHIVRVSDAGIDEASGTPFIVMDLLRGEDLGRALAERGALPPAEVVACLAQVALALDKMHAAGIVHRDLKPENLFMTRRDDGSPCVKVLDFGIAKVVAKSPSVDPSTQIVGTPLYMAPEQIQGARDIGPRADLYALAHLAYALLTGKPYWAEEQAAIRSGFTLLTTIVAGPVEAPVARAARAGVALPAAFDGWFARAAAIRPEGRFERASETVDALGQALGVALPRAPVSRVQPAGRSRALAVAALAGAMQSSAGADAAARTGGTGGAVVADPFGDTQRAPRRLWWIGAALAVIGGGAVVVVVTRGAPVDRGASARAEAAPVVSASASTFDGGAAPARPAAKGHE